MKNKKTVLIGAAALAVLIIPLLILGLFFRHPEKHGHTDCDHAVHEHAAAAGDEREILYWTCSMHPQVQLPGPGLCPICAMDLIPLYKEDALDADIPAIKLTEARARLAAIATSTVKRRDLSVKLRLLGTVSYDETKMADVAAWFPGRVEELYVDFVGDYVQKGEPLFRLYSPGLKVAQREHLVALKRAEGLPDEGRVRTLQSSRRRLKLLGMLPSQIRKLEERGEPEDVIDFYAPGTGVIIERNAFEGKYVRTGEKLFHIADLSAVWVLTDVYEKDFGFVSAGQELEFIAKAYPGERFRGEVAFIDPVVDRRTRTARLRMEVPNPEGRLKPGMFGTAVLLHNLGETLSIPYTAPLLTGKRALVYVEEEPLMYTGREVELGARAGDYYAVISGLEEGERVVTRGNFKLDAALQIRDRPSMMRLMEERTEIERVVPDVAPHTHHSHNSQTLCPVMGGPIDRQLYADINGYRVYVCCPGCIPELTQHPEKYLRKLEDAGVEIEKTGEHVH